MKKQNAYGNYLVRNRLYYCFRIKVPLDLQQYVGRKELRRSLGIRYLTEARELSNRIARNVLHLFQRLRKETHTLPQLSEENIQEIINGYIKDTLPVTRRSSILVSKTYAIALSYGKRIDGQ